MRDILVHQYYGDNIAKSIVITAIRNDLPLLKDVMVNVLADHNKKAL